MKIKSEKTVFVGTAYSLQDDDADKNGVKSLYKYDIGIYSTLVKAEAAVKTWLKTVADWELDILGIDIVEKKLDQTDTFQTDTFSMFESIRTYDETGKLFTETLLDEQCVKGFCGRETAAPLEVGCIAYMNCGNTAEPVLVIQTPMTKDEWTTYMHPDVVGDYVDDSYTVITLDSGHEHPLTTSLFRFKGIVMKKLENALWKEFRRYVKDCFTHKVRLPKNRFGLKPGWADFK